MSDAELCYAGIAQLSQRLSRKQLSPVELASALLDRIDEFDPQLHAYARVTRELAMEQAKRAEAEIGRGECRGPLHGVPVAVKDLCFTRGIPTAAGMRIHAEFVPDHDATVVTRLREAGAVLLGKLQLTEGAMAAHHPDITPPVNPWSAGHWTGVSSSGSGVATAAGLCIASLGSDTGGSIRFPCAMNGVTGIKPTWGRVSRYGVFDLAPTLDHVGPMTRSAEDAGYVLQAIAGADENDPTALRDPVPDYVAGEASVRGLRIGVDVSEIFNGVEAPVAEAVRGAIDALGGLGAHITEIGLPTGRALAEGWGAWCAAEAAVAHEASFPARADEYGEALRGFLTVGAAIPGTVLARLALERRVFAAELAAGFEQVDLVLVPVLPMRVPRVEQAATITSSAADVGTFLRFTAPFDFSGSPTITLPCGFDGAGVPLAFQLVAPHLAEARLVTAGRAYQDATDWHRRRPEIASEPA
jgi:amidase